jgi:hypothetical protein
MDRYFRTVALLFLIRKVCVKGVADFDFVLALCSALLSFTALALLLSMNKCQNVQQQQKTMI